MLELILQRELKSDEKKITIAFTILSTMFLLLMADVVYLNFSSHNKLASESTTPSPTVTAAQDTPTPPITPRQYVVTNTTKDYFIPLGTGTSNISSWTDVPDAQVSLNFGNYSGIQQILFEVATYVPTGNEAVWVRLYDETDGYPITNTTISIPANVTGFQSAQITSWPNGTKTYSVQMMTQLQSPANITLARLHIIVN